MWPNYCSCFPPSLAIIIGLIIVLIYWILKNSIRRNKISKQIPGPKFGLFNILGNLPDLHNFYDKSVHIHPVVGLFKLCQKYCEDYRKQGMCCIWLMYQPTVFLFKAQTVEKVISAVKTTKKSGVYRFLQPWLGTGLLTSNGNKWKSRRRLLTHSFHFDILKEFMPVFNKQSQKLVEILRKETTKDSVDIVPLVTLCTLDIICETMLGVEINAQEKKTSDYIEALKRALSILSERVTESAMWYDFIFNLTKRGKQLKKDIELLHRFTRSVIQEKKQKYIYNEESRKSKRKTFMDILLDHHMQYKELSEDDIREEVDTFTFGGHDTTSMAISWTMYLIGLNKDAQKRLHEEMDRIFGEDTESDVTTDDLNSMSYLECVIKESLRLYPSANTIVRETTEDIDINGSKIPKGTQCNVLIYCLHRDEEVFPDPEKFDPDRFSPENSIGRNPFAYIPFSAGPRNCIGQRYAQMELKMVLSQLLRYFTLESLDAREKVIPKPQIILRSLYPIRINIKPRYFP